MLDFSNINSYNLLNIIRFPPLVVHQLNKQDPVNFFTRSGHDAFINNSPLSIHRSTVHIVHSLFFNHIGLMFL